MLVRAKISTPSVAAYPGLFVKKPARRMEPQPRVATTAWDLLVWTYQVQMAHLRDRDDSGAYHGELSPTGVVVQRLMFGTSIDCSRKSFGPLGVPDMACHDDARLVNSEVLDMTCWRSLIGSAIAGVPPRWNAYIEPLRVEPELRGNGKPKMVYHNNRPIMCLLRYEGTKPAVATELTRFVRAAYAEWWSGLARLYEKLKGGDALKSWRVVNIGALAEPWLKKGS